MRGTGWSSEGDVISDVSFNLIAPDMTNRPTNLTLPVGGLEIQATIDPEDSVVDRFFAGYDDSFILPSEKESLRGFRECLALNLPPHYQALADLYGPFREIVFVATDPGLGANRVVGGGNFICYPIATDTDERHDACSLGMNLNYVFVLQEHRRHGYFKKLVQCCEHVARVFLADVAVSAPDAAWREAALLMFIEQNDPVRMDRADYDLDSRHSGLDQVDRIGIWNSLGARIIEFPYAQPPLSDDQQADENLVLSVLGAGESALDACIFREHLRRFFGISVLKGRPAQDNPTAGVQLSSLERMCRNGSRISLLDAGGWVRKQKLSMRSPYSASSSLVEELKRKE